MNEYNCRVKRVVPKGKLFTHITPYNLSQEYQLAVIRTPEMYLVYRRWRTEPGMHSPWALMPHESHIFGVTLRHIDEQFVAECIIKYCK